MTADNEQVTSANASAHAATQLRRGAKSTSRVEPETGPATGVNGRGSSAPAVRVEGVVKRFGATVALDRAELEVPAGMVFGLLGPNGAGKTTLVRVPLATLLAPESRPGGGPRPRRSGEPAAVRELIGLTGQFAAVDELLTGRENLEMFGRLFKLSREDAHRRAGELLERFDLAQAAEPAGPDLLRRDAPPARHRLEPADPPAGAVPGRADHGPGIRAAATRSGPSCANCSAGGQRLLLTTQYLEEADQLADRIAVIDRGKVVRGRGNRERAQGPRRRPDPGGQLASAGQRDRAQAVLAGVGWAILGPDERPDRLTLPAPRNGLQLVEEAAAGLRRAQIGVSDIGLRQAHAGRCLPAADRYPAQRGRRRA